MGRQLSRLECEYVLSSLEELRPSLEVSLMQDQLSAAKAPAFCSPGHYSYNPNSMSFFFDDAFIKKANLPRGIPCSFCFFYKTRRICFTAAITSVNGKSFCRANGLFYADDDPFFLASQRGKLLFTSDALLGVLDLRVLKDFPLNIANRDARKKRFLGFADSEAWETVFGEIGTGKSGILFYIDSCEALACFPLAAAATLLKCGSHPFWLADKEEAESEPLDSATLASKIAELNNQPQQAHASLKFGSRTIEADANALLSAYSDNLLFCSLSLLNLVPEDIRFIYEMSHEEKYTGDELP